MSDAAGLGNTIKVWLEVIREALVIAVVVLVIIFRQQVFSFLQANGVTTLKTPIADFALGQVQQAGGSLDSAQRTIGDASAALKTIASTPLPPATRAQLDSVASSLQSSVTQLETPKSVLSQIPLAAPTSSTQTSSASVPAGWIFVGHVNDAKTEWSEQSRVVSNPQPSFQSGDVVAINSQGYIRADVSGTEQRNQAPVVGVVRAGQKVRVTEVGYTRALRGGWFLWLRVTSP
jgi:hypothetical protein